MGLKTQTTFPKPSKYVSGMFSQFFDQFLIFENFGQNNLKNNFLTKMSIFFFFFSVLSFFLFFFFFFKKLKTIFTISYKIARVAQSFQISKQQIT